MEPTSRETSSSPSRRKYHPLMTSEERLAGLRAIRGMWKGKAADILKAIEQGRDEAGRELPPRPR